MPPCTTPAHRAHHRAHASVQVPWAGEFHGLAHLTDGIVILNWTYVLEPILLHFGVPGFHLKLNMNETSQRLRCEVGGFASGGNSMSHLSTSEYFRDPLFSLLIAHRMSRPRPWLACSSCGRWITLILCGGIKWLKSIYSPADLAKPEQLLKKLEKNLPAWCFVGFLYYHAGMVWATRKGIQVRPCSMCMQHMSTCTCCLLIP